MKIKLIVMMLFVLLASCAQHSPEQELSIGNERAAISGVRANNGAAVATELNRRYALSWPNCWKSETAPSFLCSGVIIRGTVSGAGYNVWDPSPGSVAIGGVSFSYMRSDAKFPALANHANNGYIVKPISAVPDSEMALDYLCFYPIDGATSNRNINGCGQHKLHGAISRPCAEQGVATADQFYAHYMANTEIRHQKQCSFDMRDGSPLQTAVLFRAAVSVMPRLPKNGRYDENELVARVWTVQPAAKMPIEAFFYTSGSANGRAQAMGNQKSFYEKSGGKIVPVIQLTIPASQVASFSYSTADQHYQ